MLLRGNFPKHLWCPNQSGKAFPSKLAFLSSAANVSSKLAPLLALIVLGIYPAPSEAQTIPSTVQPGRERQQFTPPVAPLSHAPAAFLQLPETMAPADADKIRLRLASLTVEGSTVYSEAELNALAADLVGKDISAAAIYNLASKISAKYGKDGYLVARAIIVPQAVDPKHASIRLKVVEGYIETVSWPAEANRYRDVFTPCLNKIKAERPAKTKTIERCLLLANDVPGLTFSSTVKAGKNSDGGVELVVSLKERPFSASVSVDNHGSKGRGPWEHVTSVTENNRLRLDESLTFTYAGSLEPKELYYLSGSYHQVLNSDGLAFDMTAAYSHGWPGLTSLKSLDFNSTSSSFEAGFSYPLIRSREQNLRISALGFVEDTKGETLGSTYSDDRLRGLRARFNYDQVDAWLGSIGQSQIITTVSQGFDGLGSTGNDNATASVANGRVDFTKLEFVASRTQDLTHGFSLYGAFSGQWSRTALLSSEQCGYGGKFIGRAFDPNELSGDLCASTVAEARYDLPVHGENLTQAQIYAFSDYANLHIKDAAASTKDDLNGASLGAGLRLGWRDIANADLYAAKPVSGRDDKDWRFFVAFSAHY